MNKKGISGVVVTVILVAMAVGLVAIVWVVVANLIDEGLGSAVSGSSRVTLEIDDSGLKATDTGYSVRVTRKVGEGELAKIKFILTDSEDNSKIVEFDSSMEQSEASRFDFDLTLFGEGRLKDIAEIKVVPIILIDDEERELGFTDELDVEKMPVTAMDDLIAWYKFENNVGDSSGKGNSGTNYNVGFIEDSERGTVGSFDGAVGTEVNIPANTMFDFTGDYTLSAWVKPSVIDKNLGIIGKENNFGWGLLISSNDNKFVFGQHSCGNIRSNTVNAADRWYHVVGVYTESTTSGEIFIDGVSDVYSGAMIDGNCVDDASSVVLGKYRDIDTDIFDGQLDDVRVYSKALSDIEVQMLYME